MREKTMATITKQEQQRVMHRQAVEQSQLVGYWVKTRGITQADLDSHPHIDDVILLMKWRDAMWDKLNNNERAVWGAYWGYTYNKRKALKTKSLNKLEQITITANDRHLKNLVKTATQRQHIKALRQNPYSKSSAYMTAKSEDAAQSAPWD